MEEENINIIENIIQAVSILNKTDEYLESLVTRLSECDSLSQESRWVMRVSVLV